MADRKKKKSHLSPSFFPLERLLCIYASLVNSLCGPKVADQSGKTIILTQLQALCERGLLLQFLPRGANGNNTSTSLKATNSSSDGGGFENNNNNNNNGTTNDACSITPKYKCLVDHETIVVVATSINLPIHQYLHV